MEKHGIRYCTQCGNRLHSNGTQANGKQRWRCRMCGTACVRPRPDVSSRNRLKGFITYVLGFQARRHTSLIRSDPYEDCWTIVPEPIVTGEIYDYIVIDGTRVGDKVVAVARSSTYCIMWQYGKQEDTALWLRTLQLLPPPRAVICDGP